MRWRNGSSSKLFQRHARGYTPTEAGRDLLAVAQTTRAVRPSCQPDQGPGQGTVAGELVVTSIAGIADLLTPVMVSFQEKWPEVRVRFLTDMRVFRLDYGEAHVAIRAGSGPEEPDNVVQPLARMQVSLYASRKYVERHGRRPRRPSSPGTASSAAMARPPGRLSIVGCARRCSRTRSPMPRPSPPRWILDAARRGNRLHHQLPRLGGPGSDRNRPAPARMGNRNCGS